ncbi:hypothetical protein GQ44DRAFT_717979 [Phaeosphaeriaceae sp. PMI808]|nr:hypothetical protein GQ44DRAFT_717979 [Phaeosphaeriaceae sp. PMI808]
MLLASAVMLLPPAGLPVGTYLSPSLSLSLSFCLCVCVPTHLPTSINGKYHGMISPASRVAAVLQGPPVIEQGTVMNPDQAQN